MDAAEFFRGLQDTAKAGSKINGGVDAHLRITDLLSAIDGASEKALNAGAKVIAAAAIRNVAAHKLSRPGGYHKTPGAMQEQIRTGPTKARGKPAGSIVLGFPGMQVEYGTKRSTAVHFLKDAVTDNIEAVGHAIRNTIG